MPPRRWPSSSPAATLISTLPGPATGPGPTRWWAAPSTTPPAKPTTRSPSCWGWAIPAARGSTPWPDSAIPHAVPFAFAQIKPKAHLQGKAPRTKAARTAPIADLDPHFLFSFSGIKTAVLRYVELHRMREEAQASVPRMLAMGKPPQSREAALDLCPQPTLDLIASFPARGGRRPDEEDLRRGRIAGRHAHSGHRRSGGQPRTARPLHGRGRAAPLDDRLSNPGALDRQRRHDCRGGVAAIRRRRVRAGMTLRRSLAGPCDIARHTVSRARDPRCYNRKGAIGPQFH